MLYNPHNYQGFAHKHILSNPFSGLFLGMGLGKTVIAGTAINDLIFDDMEVEKCLIIAPKRVAEDTWTSEFEKWDHLKHLRVSLILGDEKKRRSALKAKADVYIINRENVVWLVGFYGLAWPFDMLVIDELSSFKAADSRRFRALRSIRPKIKRVVGLTGTPAPNGLMDLWSQLYLLDQGERLGKTIGEYRRNYFNEGQRNGHVVHNYELKTDKKDGLLGADFYEKEIFHKISDICISMKARDYLDLPDRLDTITDVKLSAKVMEQYLEFERDLILALPDDEDITAVNGGALSTKLSQFANGAVYREDKTYYEVHNEKIEALIENIEMMRPQDNVLLFYWYQHDLERIQKYLKAFKPRVLSGKQDIADWNSKKVKLMCAHPQSAGHGLNLQHGGNLIEWFGPIWSVELYQQGIGRLDRQGQTMPVVNNRIVAKGTADDDKVTRVVGKILTQDDLLNATKARIAKYR